MRWVLSWPLCALGAWVGSEECWWWLRALGPLAVTRSISATLLNLCQAWGLCAPLPAPLVTYWPGNRHLPRASLVSVETAPEEAETFSGLPVGWPTQGPGLFGSGVS